MSQEANFWIYLSLYVMRQWEVLAAKKEKNRWRQTVLPDGKKHFVHFFMHMIFAINSFCQRVYPCEGTGARRSSLFSLLTILCFYALLCFCAIFHSGKFRLNLFRSLEKTTVFWSQVFQDNCKVEWMVDRGVCIYQASQRRKSAQMASKRRRPNPLSMSHVICLDVCGRIHLYVL